MTDKPKLIHSTKLFGGRETAEDVWRRTVLGNKKCDGCGAPPVIFAITYAPLDEVMKREGIGYLRYLAQRATGDPSRVPLVKLASRRDDTEGEKHVLISKSYACERCRPTMERAMAKGPSWVLHHFERGPGADKTVMQVINGGRE